jgi:5-formyltetrahydrofolate cyclo-ligase
VAAAFSAQLLDAVPMAPYDQYVDLIVTENGSLPARR